MARTGIMLCYPMEESRLAKWTPPYFVQPKLDGDRARAIIGHQGEVVLLSSEQNVITSVPHINQAIEALNLTNVELDGELYTHGMNHELVHGIASRTVNLHSQMEELEYHIFDMVANLPQYERTRLLFEAIYPKLKSPLVMVPVQFCNTLEDVLFAYDRFVEKGYEGIIIRDHLAPYVRKRSTQVMKFKPKKSDYYVVVGYEEEISISGQPKNSLGALVCRANEGENTFNVGTGFSAEQRRDLWKQRQDLPGKIVEVLYQHITSGRGVPRFPVFSKVIWNLGQKHNLDEVLPK